MDPRYPIGKFEMPASVTPTRRQQAIDEIAATPTHHTAKEAGRCARSSTTFRTATSMLTSD